MPHIFTTITVDWEGRILDEVNLLTMRAFNATFPIVPITHFICPAYLTRPSAPGDIVAMAHEINETIKDGDEVALHIHCWYSLVMNSGKADFLRKPTFYRDNEPGQCVDTPGAAWGNQDCGHGVPLGCYSVSRIRHILVTGKQLLRDAGIKNTDDASGGLQSFRCGGWIACDNVLDGVQQAGFRYEASAAPSLHFSNVVQPVYPDVPVYSWIAKMWSGTARRQFLPYFRANSRNAKAYPAGVQGMFPQAITTVISDPVWMSNLIQIPDTGALADYASQDTLQMYIDAADDQKNRTGKDVFISMGWHQETATSDNQFHPDVGNIKVIANILNNNPGRLTFLTVTQAARFWQESQLSVPVFPREEELVKLKHPVTLPSIPVTKREIIHG